jgi:hypothetical protein
MQAIAQQPSPHLPLKPSCLVWYADDPCDGLVQQYHQAVETRQQPEWQVSVTALVQKQISDRQKQIGDQQSQIKTLQLKIESHTGEALQSQAHNEALLNGIGAGVGSALALLVAVASFRRLARISTASEHEQERAASARQQWHDSDREVINLGDDRNYSLGPSVMSDVPGRGNIPA